MRRFLKNSHFWTFLVSYESKLLKIKRESTPFFAIASRFVTFFGTGMPKSLNQFLYTFLLFCFCFSFFPCFSHFPAVVNCQLTANCQLPVSSRIFDEASSKTEILTKRWRGECFFRFQIYKPFLYIFEAQYHSALGIIAGLVSLPSTGFFIIVRGGFFM